MDDTLVRARVAGRTAADAVTDLYLAEGASISNQHGPHAAKAFFERLRDNLLGICPLKTVEPPATILPEKKRERPANMTVSWEKDVSDRMVLVSWEDTVKGETDKAFLIGEQWVPKSQTADGLEVGDYVEEWPVTRWYADKAELETVE